MSEAMINLVSKRTISLMNRDECAVFKEEEERIRDDHTYSIPLLQRVQLGQLSLPFTRVLKCALRI